jgi:hypothetical protein
MAKDFNLEFLPEDAEWMALQQHVIDIVGKPIEDLEWRDLPGVYTALTDGEQTALRAYRRRKRLETSTEFGGIKNFRPWQERRCEQTLERLVHFQDWIRTLSARLTGISIRECEEHYENVPKRIEGELFSFIRRFDGLEQAPDKEEQPWSRITKIARNIGVVPPIGDEASEMVEGFYDLLETRRNEILEQQKALASKAAESELNREPEEQPKPRMRLWDVTYSLPMFGISTTIRLRIDAQDENEAMDYACDFFSGKNGGAFDAKAASGQRRKVYQMSDSDAWKWKRMKKKAARRGIVRTYGVDVYCPTLHKRKTYRITSSSRTNAWNKGLRRFFDEFPVVLTDGLTVGGDCKVAK